MNNQNNNLFNNFYKYQQSRIPMQQNNLLRNNPVFNNNIRYNQNQTQQMKQMQMANMIKHMQKVKMQQEMKKQEKLKNLNKIDTKLITKTIIKPEENNITDKDKEEIELYYNQLEDKYKNDANYKKNIKKYWDKRTNTPYKNILVKEDYTKNFKDKKDLIVYKVTDEDKDEEKLEFEYKDLEKNVENHDNELKIIYSTSKEAQYKKKFEYNNVYKFRIKYDPKDHQEKKQDKIEYYKKEQKRLEKGNKKFNDIVESMVTNDLFDKNQLEKLGITNNNNEISVDMEKIDQLESELKNSLGNDEYNKLMDVTQTKENTKQDDSNNKKNKKQNNSNNKENKENKENKKRKTIAKRRKRTVR